MTWIPLSVHSQYSVLDASAPIKRIVQKASEYGMPAVALTDHGNVFGAVEFFKACKGAGVKAIIGCSLYEAPGSRHTKERVPGQRNSHGIGILAKNEAGYHNLCRLSSAGYLEGFYYVPRVDRELLEKYSEGLICLSGDLTGRVACAAGDPDKLREEISWYRNVFGDDYYLELQRHAMSEEDLQADGIYQEAWLQQQYQEMVAAQEQANAALVAMGNELGVACVATNGSHYLERQDWRAHEILLNVSSGEPTEIWEKDSMGNPKFRIPNPKRHTYASHELYFKSPEQMAALFSDLPEAVSNTLAVADKCSLELDMETKHYPVYITPDLEGKEYSKDQQQQAAEAYLRHLCAEGVARKYTAERLAEVQKVYPDKDPMAVVNERIEYEMSIIAPKGMCDYLLIVWDFIHWAKEGGIPVGPGRGSGAGSIVCYLIGITDIEPLRFNLFFERFINPERLSYPDIDVDICMDRRGEVINYTLGKYGKENVAQIITFGTMKAKSAIKDVGRVLSVPLAKVNGIAKLIPDELNITIEKALEVDVELSQQYSADEEARRIIDMALSLEGSIRNTGIHAAGIIICGDPLTDYIPLTNAKDSELPVTQYSMKPVEAVGMLKVDFLGLKTLTAIQTCVNAIAEDGGPTIDWRSLPLDDAPAFELLNHGKTMGVFQMESGGMADLAKQLHLDKFEEIIAVLSLYRPGPMDMIPSFIARKHGREPIEYDHPWLEDILSETYGIMVYQEQVMAIAGKVANYSLGEGDVLRRAMGKKDAEQMAKEREKFRAGALENDVSEEISMAIFDKMEKFAAYGFNKSHAAAYGYITYVTAFLKANYPSEWMAALMTCDRDDITKVAKFIGEAQVMGIELLPPDVNEAGTRFAATPKGIRFAISGVKGVGQGVVETIIAERKENGPYKSLYDFFKRIDCKKVGKRAVENIIEAGGFDFTGWSRDALRLSVEPMFDAAASEQKDHAAGMLSLFASLEEEDDGRFSQPPEVKRPSTQLDKLLKEKELLGFFLTGHPLEMFKDVLQRLSCVPLEAVETIPDDSVFRAAFIIESHNVRIASKSQKKFAITVISDGIHRYEVPIWPDLYEEKAEFIKDNQLVYAVLQLENRDGERKLSCKWLADLTQASEAMIKECDDAFDRAKVQLERFQYRKALGESKEKSKEGSAEKAPKKEITKVSVACSVDDMRLSHILELKGVIHRFGGCIPLQVAFKNTSKEVAILHVDANAGVDADEPFKEEVLRVPGVTECRYS